MVYLAAAAALYFALVLLLWFGQKSLIFYPGDGPGITPGVLGFEYRDQWIMADDGVRLHAWWIPCPEERLTVIFCHGNAGDMGDRLDTINALHELGLSVMIFDYRGYGRSGGSPGERGLYRDVEAVWRHVTIELALDPDTVLFWGRSLGGAVAAHGALKFDAPGLVLESCFTSLPDMASRLYRFFPARLLTRYRFDALSMVRRYEGRTLVMHSPADQLVPVSMGHRLHQAARNPLPFVELAGGHNEAHIAGAAAWSQGALDLLTLLLHDYHESQLAKDDSTG